MPFQFEEITDIATRGLQHPNPLFDFLTTFVPRKLKTLFQYCEYLYYNSPQIFAALNKFAIYPVTEFIYETENDSLRKNYKNLVEDIIKLKAMLIRTGIDRHVYGNSFTSIYFPFHRFLRCPACHAKRNIEYLDYKFKLKELQFQYRCPDCNAQVDGEVVDEKIQRAKNIHIIRWDPKQIDIEYNPITGESEYYYEIPSALYENVRRGESSLINTMPYAFLETISQKKIFKFARDSIYHMKVDAPAGIDASWGFPPLTSTIKQFFYVAVLRKANEAISMEHIIPFRILHPQQISANADPVITISLANWINEVKMNIKQWRRDPLHLMFSPVAMDVTSLGGQGRALMVTGEIREAEENIITSMGIPREFLYGGLSSTGSGVTLRMLENQLLNYTTELVDLAQWITNKCGKFLGWEPIRMKLQPFKLVDDVQQKGALLQANQMAGGQMLSMTSLAGMFDRDLSEERDLRLQEQVDEFKFQHEVQTKIQDLETNLSDQARNQAMQGGPGYDIGKVLAQADSMAQQMLQVDPNTRQSQMHSLQTEDPVMYAVVVQRLEEAQTQQDAQMRSQMQQGGAMPPGGAPMQPGMGAV